MSKVLVIRKTDKTIHVVPLSNKAALQSYNNRLPQGKKWTFEEMDEAEASKLPFIDESYVTAGEAQIKVKDLETSISEKDSKIAELEAKLALLNAAPPVVSYPVKTPAATETVKDEVKEVVKPVAAKK